MKAKSISDSVILKICKWFILLYCILMLIYMLPDVPVFIGESNDYVLTTASLLNDGNATIVESDIIKAQELFTKYWNIQNYGFSPYLTSEGAAIPWYFPTYSIICIPFVLLMSTLGLSAEFAFPLTNLFSVIFVLFWIYRASNFSAKRKLILILFLAINPVVFIISGLQPNPSFMLLSHSLCCYGSAKNIIKQLSYSL